VTTPAEPAPPAVPAVAVPRQPDRDQHELDRARREAAVARSRYEAVLTASYDPVVVTNRAGVVVEWNGAAERTFGWTEDEAVGLHVADFLVPPEHRERHRRGLAAVTPETVLDRPMNVEALRRDGSRVPVELTLTRSVAAGTTAFIAVLRSVQERLDLARHVEDMLQRDGLTGMLNRAGLQAQLHAVLDDAAAEGRRVALLYADVDDFKDVNESLGHAVGDELLAGLARRVVAALPGATLLGRHGGDEFLAVLTGPDLDEAAIDRHARSLLEHLSTPLSVGEVDLDLTASVGVSVAPDDAANAVELLAHADSAMYRAKRSGGGSVVRYSSSSDDTRRRMALTTRLRRALADEAIDVHYQPIVDLPTGALRKVEALARWTDPDEGVIPPSVFIPLAEASKQIIALGELVLAKVARQLAEWDAQGMCVPVAAVNVSSAHLRHDRLLATIDASLAAHGLDPARLEVEFTESAVMADFGRTTALIGDLRERGIGVAIDDFGTGHSSLARLRDLPVDTVKLDRSFVAPLPEHTARALVDAFLGLARGLRLRTVAEGIETEEQRLLLLAAGCESAQGYLFAKPMPAAELSAWLGRQGPVDGPSRAHSAE
jgi:diguanylate cyclase (GGDEF)-like protein/PAS domain S-box-containing protein